MKKIFLINQGSQCCRRFVPKNRGRTHNFYWLFDRFHSHFRVNIQDEYLHLFLKDEQKLNDYFFPGFKNIKEAYKHFANVLASFDPAIKHRENLVCYNPPILRSNTTLMLDPILNLIFTQNSPPLAVLMNAQ